MLKWFKKMKNWLQSEEIIEIEEVIIETSDEDEEVRRKLPKQNLHEQSILNRKNNQVSELDAKILYQYPKGQFKFPLIPDEQPLLKRKKPEVVAKGEEHIPIRGRQKSTPPVTKVQEKKVVAAEPKRKIGSPKKPFRLTEIPSPVYGFQKPSKQVSEQEEELATVVIKPPLTVMSELDIPTFLRKNSKEQPIQDDVHPEIVEERAVVHIVSIEEEQVAPELPISVSSPSSTTTAEAAPPIVERVVIKEEVIPRKKHIPFNVVMLKQDQQRVDVSSLTRSEEKNDLFEKVSRSNSTMEMPKVDSKQAFNRNRPVQAVLPVETVQEKEIEVVSDSEEVTENSSPQMAIDSVVESEENPYYVFPDIDLLTPATRAEDDEEWLADQSYLLDETLKNFNVRARVVHVTQGPAVTRFEVQPEPGVKVNKVTNLMDDIKLSLAAQDMRMEAPIPGKHTIGIEIPNRKSKPVFLREVLESETFQTHSSPLAVALGLDISGQPIVTDLRKMPHGLIAGQTGSGKSVCINTMLVSLLYKATPQEVKLMLIDPKMVELAPYNRIPHLVSPVITDVKAATAALKWAVEEMERRYALFVHASVRDITKFNEQAEAAGQYINKLPYLLIIIDELADLMMMSPADVEEAICRIAQKARACGIHLIVATQRPSVDVITGLIKANIPTRIAFSVSSQVDSRTIIDSGGAEKLLGRGDMLFAENGSSKTVRLQGTFVSDDEIDQVVQHVKNEQQPNYLFEQEDLLQRAQVTEETDELFFEACEFVVSQHAASTSSIQRRFRVGYNRAARLMEMMEQQGIISESRGSRPRDVLISEEELEFLQ